MSPSKEERNDLYPLNKRTNIAIGYKKEEKILRAQVKNYLKNKIKRNPSVENKICFL
jgi:DNA recombination-dependent growth factor C